MVTWTSLHTELYVTKGQLIHSFIADTINLVHVQEVFQILKMPQESLNDTS